MAIRSDGTHIYKYKLTRKSKKYVLEMSVIEIKGSLFGECHLFINFLLMAQKTGKSWIDNFYAHFRYMKF